MIRKNIKIKEVGVSIATNINELYGKIHVNTHENLVFPYSRSLLIEIKIRCCCNIDLSMYSLREHCLPIQSLSFAIFYLSNCFLYVGFSFHTTKMKSQNQAQMCIALIGAHNHKLAHIYNRKGQLHLLNEQIILLGIKKANFCIG